MAADGECIHGASKLRPPKKPVELLAAGAGYRCEIGDCVNVEVERLEDWAAAHFQVHLCCEDIRASETRSAQIGFQ